MDGTQLVGKKDVSVGEYEARTGLTLITLQRGRLMFNMGPPSAKRAAAEHAARAVKSPLASDGAHVVQPSTESTAADDEAPPSHQATRQSVRVFRSGVFTGRSLYAEEAVYLVQRGALIVHELEELETVEELQASGADTREALPLAKLVAMMTRNGDLTTAFLDVYTFLRDSKLHPRRYVPTSDSDVEHAGHSHSSESVLDVYKSITETVFVTEEIKALRTIPEDADASSVEGATRESVGETDITTTPTPRTRVKKRKIKRLTLVFRVLVRSFRDAMPSPRELRGLLDAASRKAVGEEDDAVASAGPGVPVKLAVASQDRSVVLFEVT